MEATGSEPRCSQGRRVPEAGRVVCRNTGKGQHAREPWAKGAEWLCVQQGGAAERAADKMGGLRWVRREATRGFRAEAAYDWLIF